MLPSNQWISLQVVDIGQRHFTADRAEYNPANVRMKESHLDVVRVFIIVCVLVVCLLYTSELPTIYSV